jgi:hemoglobin/transferrin/lactoferrin receptor protein
VRVPDGFTFGAQSVGRGDYVDLDLLKSVEILRGPASALYGSDGLAGAVSFQTSDPADLLEGAGHSLRARATYDSASDEYSETAIAAAGGGAWSGLVAYTRRDGHELDNQGEVGGTGAARTEPNPQDSHANSLLGKLVFAPSDAHRFRLTAEYGDTFTATEVLSGRSATVLDLRGRDRTERKRISLDWRYTGAGAIDFAQVAFYWQDGSNRQFTFEDRNPAADRERLNTFDNRVIGASAEARSTFATGAVRHNLVFGGDISLTRQKGLRDGIVPPAGETFPTRAFPVTDFTRGGLFVGDEIVLGPITLYPALRFDHYSLDAKDDPLLPAFAGADQSGSRLTPRLGAVARLGAGFSLYGAYASGFRAPAPSDVNQFFRNVLVNYTSLPNPDLKPETSRTWESGLRYQGEIASASLTGFTGRYHDFISQQQVGGSFTPADPGIFQVVNLSGVRIHGVEGRFGLHLPAGLTADLAFAWADGTVIQPSGARAPLSSIDPLKIVAGAGWRDRQGRFGGQLYLTHTARKPLDETNGICAAACFRPDSSTLLDATAFWRISDNFTLRAGLFNITDERYFYWSDVVGLAATSAATGAYTQPGRNARVSLSVRF